ncbi:MAG: amidohydrolase family protein, partial [Longimicrobiales bacterium]
MLRTAMYATAALLAVALPVHAQTEAVAPSDYALINARIVVAPGRVIERGTIRIADGRIVAVGDRVVVPPGVTQIDLAGKTVYPGLIDAATSAGMPRMGGEGGGRGGRGGGGGAPQPAAAAQGRPAPPPEVRPSQMAADVFSATEDDLEAFRAAGVTTLGLAFESSGIFPGQTAAVSTGSGEASSLVLRTPVSLQVTFGRRRGGYPSTLMGAVAYIKQAFYDAEYDRRVAEAFARNPAAAPRPSYDAEHRALGPVVAGTLPAWIFGSTERDLERAAEITQELKLQNYVIVGAQEGYRALNLVKAMGKPVIVSLNFPRPDNVTGRVFENHVAPASGEDVEDQQADTAAAKLARTNASVLSKAGIPIALASYGLAGPREFRDRILAVIEAGLPADDALRALTVTPARLLGVESAVGTIEQGKIANLVVVEGDLFSKDGKIRQVFVEGERFEVREPPAGSRGGGRGGRGGGGGEGPTVNVAGDWTGSMEGASGTMPFTLTLRMEGEAVAGQLSTEMGTVALRGPLTGQDVVLRGTATPPNMNAMEITITARITGDDLRGTLVVQG